LKLEDSISIKTTHSISYIVDLTRWRKRTKFKFCIFAITYLFPQLVLEVRTVFFYQPSGWW